MEYKKLLIQQQTKSGTTYTNVGSAVDTYQSFNVVCKEFPFKKLPETKELASRDWPDEHGSDVYVPSDGLKFKSYDIDVKFYYVGSQANMSSEIGQFLNFIYGRNTGGSPLLSIYDEYTKIGKRGVYVLSVGNDLFLYDDANEEVVGEFGVKFRVTDPVTDVVIGSNSSSE